MNIFRRLIDITLEGETESFLAIIENYIDDVDNWNRDYPKIGGVLICNKFLDGNRFAIKVMSFSIPDPNYVDSVWGIGKTQRVGGMLLQDPYSQTELPLS